MNLKFANIVTVVVLVIAGVVCYSNAALLFPSANSASPVAPVDPDASITDPHGVRELAYKACQDIPEEDVLKLYGLLTASADYVAIKGSESDTMTNHDVVHLMDKALQLEGWEKGKYPAWKAAVSQSYVAYTVEKTETDSEEHTLLDCLPITRCRSEFCDVLRLLASGCRKSLMEKK